MNTIWKFHLGSAISLGLPPDAEMLHVGLDPQGDACLWVRLDPTAPVGMRDFHVVGTGHPVSPSWRHIGTYVEGPFVWHVFEAP